ILTDDGKVIDGSNHENAAYPMCLCAEQVAIANFHQHRTDQKIKSIAISARTADKLIDSPVPPCGACRQILLEVAEKLKADYEVILQGETGKIFVIPSVKALLPIQFDSSNL
ncbi:MAG TPA: cytidine deaminase, partial [Saprospiraceae bacterium]|nr:cytidine deaminase [Saprospiraceae bacterium]